MSGIAFPNPDRISIPDLEKASLPVKIVNFAASEAGDTGTIGSISKVARAIIKLLATISAISKEISDSVVSHLNSIIDTFKFLGIFKSIKTIADNAKGKEGETKSETAQRALKITDASIGMGVAGATGYKLLDTFNIAKIATVSEGLGITSIASAHARAALSFPVVTQGAEIVQNVFTIGASSLKMHDLIQKTGPLEEKARKWKDEPVEDMIAAGKLNSIPNKITAAVKCAEALAPSVEKTKAAFDKAKEHLEKVEKKEVKTTWEKIKHYFALCKAKREVKATLSSHAKVCKKFDACKDSFNKLGTQLERWKVIEDKFKAGKLTDGDKAQLATFKTAKENKWVQRVKNITWDKVKEGLTLGMSISLTLFLATTIALAIIFPVVLPLGAVIGLGIGGLLISVGFAVKHFLPKLMESEWGKKTPKPVAVPALEAAVLEEDPI